MVSSRVNRLVIILAQKLLGNERYLNFRLL